MSAISFGKRYERLLLSSAPLAIGSTFLLFTSYASITFGSSEDARCYEVASETIQSNIDELESAFQSYIDNKGNGSSYNPYKFDLQLAWIEPSIYEGCRSLTDEIESSGTTPPADLAASYRRKSAELRERPLEAHGVSIESQTVVTVLGTNINVKLESLTLALQIALAPLLILWLGSLYHTRYRETMSISQATSLTDVFPHLINVYLVGEFPELRKRSKFALWLHPRSLITIFPTLLRVLLITAVMIPTVGFYISSLYLIPTENLTGWHFFLGSVVLLHSVTVVGIEFAPKHATKIFPSQRI